MEYTHSFGVFVRWCNSYLKGRRRFLSFRKSFFSQREFDCPVRELSWSHPTAFVHTEEKKRWNGVVKKYFYISPIMVSLIISKISCFSFLWGKQIMRKWQQFYKFSKKLTSTVSSHKYDEIFYHFFLIIGDGVYAASSWHSSSWTSSRP